MPQPTLEDLQPLYQAVAHGCQAGLQQEAHDDVYSRRIRRGGTENYSLNKLGAFGADLGALACFFEQAWSVPSRNLRERDQIILLGNSAVFLRAVGRLIEALEPMRASVLQMAKLKDWKQAAIAASNLSELELTLGEVAGAEGDAEQSVSHADRSGDAFQRERARATVADALHQTGRRDEAFARFREAEVMQAERQPQYPWLYSWPGFWHCDLLLTEPERAAWQVFTSCAPRPPDEAGAYSATLQSVCQRATETLKLAEKAADLSSIGLDHLTLGRGALYTAVLESPNSNLPTAISEITAAVASLRPECVNNFETPVAGGLVSNAALPRVRVACVLES